MPNIIKEPTVYAELERERTEGCNLGWLRVLEVSF